MDALKVNLQTIDDKVMFSAAARENPQITIDFFPPIGTAKGYTSLELLMASFGSCLGTSLLTLLRYKMEKTVEGLSIEMDGRVREEHPKALTHIVMVLKFKAKDLSEAEVLKAVKVSEEKICPVWSMLKGSVAVDIKTEIQ